MNKKILYWAIGTGCFLWLIFIAPSSPIHAQSTVPVDEYWQELADLRQRLDAWEALEVGAQRVQLSGAADELAKIDAVTLPDGRIQPIDSSFWVNHLTAEEPEIEQIKHLLDTVLAEKEGWPAPSIPYDAEQMASILSRPEFDYTPEEANFLQKMWQDFRRQLGEIVAFVLDVTGLAGTLPIALNIFGAVALAFVLYYALSGLVEDFSASAKYEDNDLTEEILTADLALKRADELSSGGDYRTAVRYLYLSSLLLLEERGLLRYDRSLTNREYLRTIRHKPRLATVLRNVIEVFDRVWYGYQPISKELYNDYAKQVDTLKQQKEETE